MRFPHVGAVYDRPQFKGFQPLKMWAVIDRPYSGKSIRQAISFLRDGNKSIDDHVASHWKWSIQVARLVRCDHVGLNIAIHDDAEPRKHHLLSRHVPPADRLIRRRIE